MSNGNAKSKPSPAKAVAAGKKAGEAGNKESAKSKEVSKPSKSKKSNNQAEQNSDNASTTQEESKPVQVAKKRGRKQEWTRESLAEEMKKMADGFKASRDSNGNPTSTIEAIRVANGITANHWNKALMFVEAGDPMFAFLKEAGDGFIGRRGRIRNADKAQENSLVRQEKALEREKNRQEERIRKYEEKHQAKLAELSRLKAEAEAKAAEVKLQIQAKGGKNVAVAASVVQENNDVTVNVGAFLGNAHSPEMTPLETPLETIAVSN